MENSSQAPPKEVEAGAPHHQDGRPSTNSRFSSHATASTDGQNTVTSAGTPDSALVWLPCTGTYPQDLHTQLHRRRTASYRHQPVCDRCGARDPITCHCHEPEPPLGTRAIEAWRAAIEHTLPIGAPVVPIEVLQRLHRNGGSDRQLALQVWKRSGG